MNTKSPWHARLARTLAIILPIFLAVAALGTKFGLWSWQVGLGAVSLGGLILIGLTAVIALVSIVLILRSGNRMGMASAVFGLIVPLGFVAMFAPVALGAGDHPIHDVATDTTTPPPLSAELLAARAEGGANPINDYATPLGKTEQFAEAEGLTELTTAEVITGTYTELAPLDIGETEIDAAVNAVQLAMADMGFSGIRYDAQAFTVEGVAETFWFGFKDDMIVRVAEGRVDFRSISRVGRSDLGANAKRIMELRKRTAEKLKL